MPYTKTVWVNSTTPALNATDLNHAEQGIFDATAIAEAAAAASSFSGAAGDVTYDNTTSAIPENNVQDAIDYLDGEVDTLNATTATLTSGLNNKAPLLETAFTANLTGTNTNLPAPSTNTVSNLTLTAATGKFTLPSGFSGYVTLLVRLNQDATGGRDYQIMNGSLAIGGDGVKPVMPTGANAFMDIVVETFNGGTNWFLDKPASGGAGTSIRVEDEGGAAFSARSYLNFVGAITATDDPTDDRINVTIPFDKRWSPSDNLLKASNMDPAIAGALGTTALPSTATILVWAMKSRIADVLTGVAFDLAVAAVGTLTGPYQFALYSSDGNTLLAQTADCTSTLAGASGPTTVAWVTPYTVPADTHIYVALHTGTVAGGNATKLSGSGSTGLINLGLNVGISTSPASTAAPRFATASSTWTGTTPPAALGNITSVGAIGVLMAMY